MITTNDLARRQQLYWSIATNFLTRVPSIAIVFIFLPILHDNLGLEDYARLLTSLAAGTLLSMPFSGSGQMTARLVGQAYSVDHKTAEAHAFVSATVVNASLVAVLGIVLSAFVALYDDTLLFFVALLPILQAALNSTFDVTRLAYNEHFVTATLGVIFQLIVYTFAFFVPAFTHNTVLAAFIFSGPLLLASICGGALLLAQRPHLLQGEPTKVRDIAWKGLSFSLADGLLVSSVNIVIVWLGFVAAPVLVAWFATAGRIFLMLLNPVVLLVMPVAAYIRSIWETLARAKQARLVYLAALLCFACGIAVALLTVVVNEFYIARILHLDPGIGPLGLFPVLLLFGVITAYKGFSSIAYLVLDGNELVRGTIAILAAALLVSAVSTFVLSPLQAVQLFCVLASVPQIALMVWIALHHRRSAVASG